MQGGCKDKAESGEGGGAAMSSGRDSFLRADGSPERVFNWGGDPVRSQKMPLASLERRDASRARQKTRCPVGREAAEEKEAGSRQS